MSAQPNLSIDLLRGDYLAGRRQPRDVVAEVRAAALAGRDDNIWIHLLDEAELEPYLQQLEHGDPAALPLLLKRFDATIFAASPGIYRKILTANDRIKFTTAGHLNQVP